MSTADNIENWMHASDHERTTLQQSWNISAGDGEDIANQVANLFKDECVYQVIKVGVSKTETDWCIDAFVSSDDYENLKDRYNIEFLGFKINFLDINAYT
jgi:hypothetical protein